jgi:NADH-quinone oxidoreductase subunit D
MNAPRLPEFHLIQARRREVDLDSGRFLRLWQGPQHPGVAGNMALEVVTQGDEVWFLKTHVGYLHRGFEKLIERRSFIKSFPLVCRIAVPEPAFNEYAYCACLEALAGIQIPEKARWLRTFNLELMRLASFFMWLGGQAATIGMAAPGQWGVTYRDYLLDVFEEMTGGRIYHMYIMPGGVRADVDDALIEKTLALMDRCQDMLAEIEAVFLDNAVTKMRLQGLGPITPDLVDAFGIVGPNARASGFARDLRKDEPYLVYDQLDFKTLTDTGGDAYARVRLRCREMAQSMDLIRQILRQMPREGEIKAKLPNVMTWTLPPGRVYCKAECTRGEYGFFMQTDGSGAPRRLYVRGPSYTHGVSLMEMLSIGVNLADIAALQSSLHVYPPEIER